ncbi:MAG: tetratricopeptide repeat protein, partial [Actinobacteria bacterium]|nr:tetratricopeptide repeat protein [Actinomycetota bacterium]
RALGLACREEGALAQSASHLRRSIALATRADAPALAAEARIVLLSTYAISGRFAAALREGRLAASALEGEGLARVQAQMATVLRLQGRLDDALALYRQALRGLGHSDDPAVARLFNNRAVTHYHCGNLAGAQADFERAERLFRINGQLRLASYARQSWGIVVARQGDLPAALAAFSQADEYLSADPLPDPLALRDRAIVLLAARLVPEARDYLQRAVAQLEAAGQGGYVAEARLLLAEAELLDGRPAVARSVAEEAQRTFTRQRRPAWAALARSVALRSAWSAGERSRELLRSARRTAESLARAGFLIRAADARLLAGRIALDLGMVGVARRELKVSTQARRRGPVELRAGAWYAAALLRLQDGNRRGARTALEAGMRMIDGYRAAQGATDLRVHVASLGEELAALGSRLAFEDGDPSRILAWSERCRASSLRPRPVRPPQD